MQPTQNNNSLAIPLAIIIGFGLIAIAIYFSGFGKGGNPSNIVIPSTEEKPALSKAKAVSEEDFIRGNPNAPIMVIEYSDYDCPFCKRFHETMNQIMDEYGVGGKVAWVYRQYPIKQLHPNAPHISEAALCVGVNGGNDAFWKFSDLVFGEREVNEPTNISALAGYAEQAGVSKSVYENCMQGGSQKPVIEASLADGAAAGINGTPHSIIRVGNQEAPINGAQPYEVVKSVVDNLLKQLEG